MSQTAVEKILSQHVGQPVHPDEMVIVPVDAIMASDATAPRAIRAFEEMGGGELWRPDKVILVIDHAAPAPNQRISNLHRMMRNFAQEKGCRFYDVGAGICHQVMVENRHVQPTLTGDGPFIGAAEDTLKTHPQLHFLLTRQVDHFSQILHGLGERDVGVFTTVSVTHRDG